MNSLTGIIVTLLFTLWFGKRTSEFHLGTYLVIGFIALVQVVIVLYDMFTMAKPAIPGM